MVQFVSLLLAAVIIVGLQLYRFHKEKKLEEIRCSMEQYLPPLNPEHQKDVREWVTDPKEDNSSYDLEAENSLEG